MTDIDRDRLLRQAADLAADFLAALPTGRSGRPWTWRRCGPPSADRCPTGVSRPRTSSTGSPATPIRDSSRSTGPRYFGFVVGGGVPASLAADWLTSAWDQNAGLYALSPAASVVEEVAAGWLVDLFGLPAGSSVGFTTGATMANFTALAAARHRVLERVGWDVEDDGLIGAPPIEVVVGDEAHVTIFVSLQMLGLGRGRVHRVAADEQGRMRADALRETLAGIDGPTIVCAQAGNVNTGGVRPAAGDRRRRRASDRTPGSTSTARSGCGPRPRRRCATGSPGLAVADSWTTDAHKWLNVPYDSGIVDRPRRGAPTTPR